MINRYKFGDTPWLLEGIEERLRELTRRRTAEQVAQVLNMEFGTSLTRNAIIGRCRRTKIPLGSGNANQHGPSKKPKKLVNHGSYFKVAKEPVRPPTMPKAHIPKTGEHPYRCSILELDNATCRWPIGDPRKPDFFYCGVPEANNAIKKPYCSEHERVAWRR